MCRQARASACASGEVCACACASPARTLSRVCTRARASSPATHAQLAQGKERAREPTEGSFAEGLTDVIVLFDARRKEREHSHLACWSRQRAWRVCGSGGEGAPGAPGPGGEGAPGLLRVPMDVRRASACVRAGQAGPGPGARFPPPVGSQGLFAPRPHGRRACTRGARGAVPVSDPRYCALCDEAWALFVFSYLA